HICRTALNRCVDGVSLGKAPHRGVPTVDVPQISSSSQDGFYILIFLCFLDALIHIGFDPGEFLEISINNFFGLTSGYTQTLGQAESGDTINDTEVGSFGLSSHIRGNAVQWYLEDFGGSGCVDIASLSEGFNHGLIFGKRSHDPKFDLGIIRCQDAVIFIPWYKCLPDFPS